MSGNQWDDPNVFAEQLAKLSRDAADKAYKHARSVRNIAPQTSDASSSSSAAISDPNALAVKLANNVAHPAGAAETKEEKPTPAPQSPAQPVAKAEAPTPSPAAPAKPKEEKPTPAPQPPAQPVEKAEAPTPSPAAPVETKEEKPTPAPQSPAQPVEKAEAPTPSPAAASKSQEKPPAAALVKSEPSDKPQIIIQGAKFVSKKPTAQDARTRNVIVAKHVDKARDKKVGVEISKYNLNYVFSDPDDRDHKFGRIFGAIDPTYLPATSDLRPSWGDILDQLDLGSCVSNSVSYCVRYSYRKQNMGDFTPSRLFIYYNGRQIAGYPIEEDSGLTIRDGYKSVAAYSVCSENNWPYVPSKFAIKPPDTCYAAAKEHSTFRYINLDNDAVQIKKSLKDGFPVSFGAALFESFMSAQTAQSGIVPVPDENKDRRVGGHAMTIVGHDDSRDAFLVCNNWGSGWGLEGFCWFPYEYMLNEDLVGDFWSIRQWS